MKKQRDFLFDIILVFLIFHLYGINVKLLYHLNPDNKRADEMFSFLKFNEESIAAILFAVTYSIITVGIIKKFLKLDNRFLVLGTIIWFAGLDGFGVYVYYGIMVTAFSKFGAIYYGVYTFSMIIAVGIYKLFAPIEKEKKIVEENPVENKTVVEIHNQIEPQREDYGKALEDIVISYWGSGKYTTQKSLAEELSISPVKVHRILARYERNK